jgi:dTDP-4-dehydrorhamnose reductase
MILVFGQTGQVACALAQIAPGAVFLGRAQADLAEPDACAQAIRAYAPSAVINAAAYTAVDRAESEEELATKVNGHAPAAMAQACAALRVPFVHISTDYVFDGTGDQPFAPDHPTAPLGAYGRSKLAGEQGVRDAGGAYAILRTSWVFSAEGANFVKTMLRLGVERDALNVVSDQIGGPTQADAIAQACLAIAAQLQTAPDKSGTYHFAGQPATSWAGFARAIMAQAGLACQVTDIPSSAYPTPARRPLNSRLDCSTLQAAFGISPPDWKVGLVRVIEQLKRA